MPLLARYSYIPDNSRAIAPTSTFYQPDLLPMWKRDFRNDVITELQ
ncbi:MAG: hypothetical protein HFP77_04830 [Methylococcales symbiont of Iophon sp. n. MRB-2018]|nr:MAG: hypothetical protein HFP77_04830 [Methylococcales symbiont of Iophon sp. n. MRB-2018]